MRKKSVVVRAYINNNLGDDLFLFILANRYPNQKFIAFSRTKSYLNLPNLHIIYVPRLLNKLVKLITFNKIDLAYPKLKNHPLEVLIGGSMFIEGRSSENYLNINKKNFYLGCNFGPYKTEKYLKKYHKIFSKVNDVCFRDEYSYNLFKDLPNVRMASDIVFSLPELSYLHLSESEQKPYVVISVMDFAQNNLEEREDEYLNFLHHLIKKFILQKYQIKLVSFCKKDGDESGIKKIQNLYFTEFEKTQISTYCYHGDILEILQIFKNADAVVGTRFHATVLGLHFRVPTLPIIYSQKTKNMLDLIRFAGKIFDFNKNLQIDEYINDSFYSQPKINHEIYRNAEKHFVNLDKELNNESK